MGPHELAVTPAVTPGGSSPRRTSRRRGRRLVRALGIGVPSYGLGALYLSFLVLIPVAALLAHAFDGGPSALFHEIAQPIAEHGLILSIGCSAIVVVVNAVLGTAIAWLLVRERFVLNRPIAFLVDLPFALPTIVAGVVLVALYGATSPVGIDLAFTRYAIVTALCFVTLPFSVRSVQPVLEALDLEAEEAAASLGASAFTTFRRVTLPSLAPAILTGAGLTFARALGEYGSVSLVSGNLPLRTEVASVDIYGLIFADDLPAAAAVSLALFVSALVVLAAFTLARRRIMPPEAS